MVTSPFGLYDKENIFRLRLKAWIESLTSAITTALPLSVGNGGTGAANATTARSNLGLGTAAVKNTGTSGDAVPLLNVANTWSATQSFALTTSGGQPFGIAVANNDAAAGNTSFFKSTASPAASDGIWNLSGVSQDSGGNLTFYGRITFGVLDPTDASEDGVITLSGMAGGAFAARANVASGLYMVGATGGDQGAGTGNFTGVYDDGVLLSCYPFDAVLDGSVSAAKWDGKAPARHWPAEYEVTAVRDKDGVIVGARQRETRAARTEQRQHFGARKFAARLGGEFDPLDIDKYTAHWRQKRHLTSLPNEANYDPAKPLSTGEWLQRLIETVEIQAIHIANLNDRLKVVEARR